MSRNMYGDSVLEDSQLFGYIEEPNKDYIKNKKDIILSKIDED